MHLLKSNNKLFIALLAALALFIGLFIVQNHFVVPAGAADASDAVCESLGGTNCTTGRSTISNVIGFALNTLSLIAGIIAVIMLIISGIKFMTAGGDPQSIAGARRSVIFAIVGIAVVVISQSIVRFVVYKSTTAPTTPTTPTTPAMNPGDPF